MSASLTCQTVVWKITPLFATWITSPTNPLFRFLSSASSPSTIIELGCGISGIIGLVLSQFVDSYTLTDQPYVSKLLLQNLEENKAISRSAGQKRKSNKNRKDISTASSSSNLTFTSLDWETDSTRSLPHSYSLLIACDCIYNTALISPLIQTMVDVCKLRTEEEEPTIVVVGQQRRSSEVFEDWLVQFSRVFRVWRMSDETLGTRLGSGSGYLVHVGILREGA